MERVTTTVREFLSHDDGTIEIKLSNHISLAFRLPVHQPNRDSFEIRKGDDVIIEGADLSLIRLSKDDLVTKYIEQEEKLIRVENQLRGEILRNNSQPRPGRIIRSRRHVSEGD